MTNRAEFPSLADAVKLADAIKRDPATDARSDYETTIRAHLARIATNLDEISFVIEAQLPDRRERIATAIFVDFVAYGDSYKYAAERALKAADALIGALEEKGPAL